MFANYLAERTTGTAPADRLLTLFDQLLDHADDELPPTLEAETLLGEDLSQFAVPSEQEQAA
jgi:hypothetical protein